MSSKFLFLNEYSEFSGEAISHILHAEECLYDHPQDTVNHLVIFLEKLFKDLCVKNKIQVDYNAGATKLLNELIKDGILDWNLKYDAQQIIFSRNNSLHNDVKDSDQAKICLRSMYNFLKKYIRFYIDSTVLDGNYVCPGPEEIKSRKLEALMPENYILQARDESYNNLTQLIGESRTDKKTAGKIQSTNKVIADDSEYLKGLNNEQLKAVTETEGYVKVIAGPGTGKTKTLTSRYVHLVKKNLAKPENILCLTFTNKAAKEMQDRIIKLLGTCDSSQVCTFHSFCHYILVKNADALNLSKNFIIWDNDDKNNIIQEIKDEIANGLSGNSEKNEVNYNFTKPLAYKNHNIEYDEMGLRRNFDYFEGVKFLKECPIYKKDTLGLWFSKTSDDVKAKIEEYKGYAEEICYRYILKQRDYSAMDFDDIITATGYLFGIRKDIAEFWQNKLHYIMVDEYQDVNETQAKMCQFLAGKHNNLFVVGDPNQTIYSWRGSSVRFINKFQTNTQEKNITLLQNYRSSPEILNLAKNLISQQDDFEFIANAQTGEKPFFYLAESRADEANWIVNKMEELSLSGVKPNKIAVLFRMNRQSQNIELELIRRNLNYKLLGGNKFYNSPEIKAIHSYLELIAYDSDFAFKKAIGKPPRSIGAKTIDKLKEIQNIENVSLFEALKIVSNQDGFFKIKDTKNKAVQFVKFIEEIRGELTTSSLFKIVSDIIEKSGYIEYIRKNEIIENNENNGGIQNLLALLKSIKDREEDNLQNGITDYSVEDYLKDIATYTSSDETAKNDSFVLSTVHGAKGLEYEYVFVCGLEAGNFPKHNAGINEERRLCYVAVTRAIKGLFLSSSKMEDGWNSVRKISTFVKEMGFEINENK